MDASGVPAFSQSPTLVSASSALLAVPAPRLQIGQVARPGLWTRSTFGRYSFAIPAVATAVPIMLGWRLMIHASRAPRTPIEVGLAANIVTSQQPASRALWRW